MAPRKSSEPAEAKLIPAEEVFAEWHKDPAYREAYDALDEEFAIVEALMKARAHRALLKTLRSYAKATGHGIVSPLNLCRTLSV